ncbi:MAG TPA: protein YgfX [Burkholderiales bacterium]|nr:protein YgfX [Burkholderiales bacterium]
MTALRIAVAASALLGAGIAVTHAAAVAVFWFVPLALPMQVLLTLAVAASLAYLVYRHALLRAPQSIVALETHDGSLSVRTRQGEWLEGEVLGSSYVSAIITIVNFLPHGRWRVLHVILVPDNSNPQDFRHLRTWLRWKKGEEEALNPPKEA